MLLQRKNDIYASGSCYGNEAAAWLREGLEKQGSHMVEGGARETRQPHG